MGLGLQSGRDTASNGVLHDYSDTASGSLSPCFPSVLVLPPATLPLLCSVYRFGFFRSLGQETVASPSLFLTRTRLCFGTGSFRRCGKHCPCQPHGGFQLYVRQARLCRSRWENYPGLHQLPSKPILLKSEFANERREKSSVLLYDTSV